MVRAACLLLILCIPVVAQNSSTATNSGSGVQKAVYAADGSLMFPASYREWTYLTSGIDMSYSPAAMAGHSMFDNVFVNPEAYKAFVQTGTWPDKTILVLEIRGAGSKGSINKSGHFQTSEVMGREVHIKDQARFAATGGWAFFGFDNGDKGIQLPKEAACYSCHQQHAAVDTTFVQFYPTLLSIAQSKSTLSPNYLKEEATAPGDADQKKK